MTEWSAQVKAKLREKIYEVTDRACVAFQNLIVYAPGSVAPAHTPLGKD